MSRPTIGFYGGVCEIGGNKIVVRDGPDQVLFDFGPSFSPEFEEYYVDYLQPRSTSPVKDLLEFGLLPRLAGLYSEEALAHSDLPYEEPRFQGIFLSHAHADHAGYLHLIDPKIPVHVGRGTRSLLAAIEGSTSQKYGEHAFQEFRDLEPIRVGSIEVTPYPVDHSIPFAYGYLIRTSEGAIAYSGDFRRHGPRAGNTLAFFEAIRDAEPAILAIEGTRAGPDARTNLTEAGVKSCVDGILARSPGLAIACTYPRDVDRLTSLYAAALDSDRTLVVSLRTAHLLGSIPPATPGLPALTLGPASPRLAVYERRKKVYYKWEKPLLDRSIDAETIRAGGRKYLLALDFYHFGELIDLHPPRESPFIHSMSEPFSEDDLNDRVLHNWLDHFGMRFFQAHASGHASETELFDIVRASAPRTVFPIHTEHPEAFGRLGPSVRLPEKGATYSLDGARSA